MKRGIAVVCALVLVLAATSASHALPLSDLLIGGTVTSGDLLFDNWSVSFYDASDGRSFNAANIDVMGNTGGVFDPGMGLTFHVSNNELNVTGDDIYAYIDLTFGFRVSVLDPTLRITENILSFGYGGAALTYMIDGSFDLGMYIGETVGSALGLNDLSSTNIEFSRPSSYGSPANSAVFAPQNEIWVTKNILVWSVDSTDTAKLWGFAQQFSLTPVGVPEPGMLALMALGGIALLRFKRG